jgi:catechol 2,3-dioxygenase-like lactoylglutathione lyase family enzyme
MKLTINHISIPVKNLEKALEFYTKFLEFKIKDVSDRAQAFSEKVTGIKGVVLKIAYIYHDEITLELIEYAGNHQYKEQIFSNILAMNHFCFNIDNIANFYDQYKSDIEFINIPTEIFAGPNKRGFMAYFKDYDGNKIELIQKPTK